MEYDVKSANKIALKEISYVAAVIGVYFEDKEVSASCREDGWGVSTGDIVHTYSYTLVCTYIGKDTLVTDKPIMVFFWGVMTSPTSYCLWYSLDPYSVKSTEISMDTYFYKNQ